MATPGAIKSQPALPLCAGMWGSDMGQLHTGGYTGKSHGAVTLGSHTGGDSEEQFIMYVD